MATLQGGKIIIPINTFQGVLLQLSTQAPQFPIASSKIFPLVSHATKSPIPQLPQIPLSTRNLFLLLYWLRRYCGQIEISELSKSFFKILTASIAMGTTCFFFHSWLYSFSSTGSIIWRFTVLSFSIVAGLLSLSLSCKIMRVREFDSALRMFTRRSGLSS